MIKFTCPSCKSGCSVDDKFAKRKLKCPTCGARVLHLGDTRVELLTAGAAVPAKSSSAASAETQPASPSISDVTPIATAVPHSVTELIGQSESKQNLYLGAGLLLVFCLVTILLGFILSMKVLIVAPIAVLLSAVGIYLWMHTQKIKKRLAERQKK